MTRAATPNTPETINEMVRTLTNITSSEDNARGLVAPVIRAMGHILFALAALSETPVTMTEEEILDELRAASAHLTGTLTHNPEYLSAPTAGAVTNFAAAVRLTSEAAGSWTPEQRISALGTVATAGAGLATLLDRDLAGISVRDSYPGNSL
jgi:hypothetical protein